jgi:hypothetical protein
MSSRSIATFVASLLAAFALGALGGPGCSNPPCIRHSDCDVGLICGEGGICVTPPDAAPEDDSDGGERVDAAPRPDGGPDATPEPDGAPPPDADPTLEEPDAS